MSKEGHLDTPANAGYSMTLGVITLILGLPVFTEGRRAMH